MNSGHKKTNYENTKKYEKAKNSLSSLLKIGVSNPVWTLTWPGQNKRENLAD